MQNAVAHGDEDARHRLRVEPEGDEEGHVRRREAQARQGASTALAGPLTINVIAGRRVEQRAGARAQAEDLRCCATARRR